MNINKILCLFLYFSLSIPLIAKDLNKNYYLWYDRPGFNRGADYSRVVSRGFPFDQNWERCSLPIGNGAIGPFVFGLTDT